MQHRKPTITDVARVAGISRAAASRAINNGPGVSDRVRVRVRQAIDDLGYRPNPAAQALASGRTNLIELVIVDGNTARIGVNPYYGRVIAGIAAALAGTETQMRVHAVAEPDAPRLMDRIARSVTLGAVLVNMPPALAAQFHERYARVVALGRSARRVPAVEAENSAGAYGAVTHLHEVGRRRIAAIHGPATNTCAASRRAGHLDAIRDAGLPDISGGGLFCRETGFRATRQLLAENPDLDAMFVACDLMAAGAMQALAAAGRRVPDDVAVVGFDDSVIAACASPPMTSVRQPVEEMAAASARALMNGEVAPHWRRVFPVELVVRESSRGRPESALC